MNDMGGGGGAGGVLTNIPGMMPATSTISDVQSGAPNALTISIGQGGQGIFSYNNKVNQRNDGGVSSTMSGTGINVTATGGGSASATNGPGTSMVVKDQHILEMVVLVVALEWVEVVMGSGSGIAGQGNPEILDLELVVVAARVIVVVL